MREVDLPPNKRMQLMDAQYSRSESLMLRSLICGIAVLLTAGESLAQAPVSLELRPGPSLLRVPPARQEFFPGSSVLTADTAATVPPATYWLEGALIGGTAIGFLLGAFAFEGCTHDDSSASGPCWDNALLGAALGFGIGGTFGALLGGLVPKPERPPVDSLASD